MEVQLSHPAPDQSYPDHSEISPTEKKIHVQNSKYSGGYGMLPHSIDRTLMRMDGSKSNVFRYIWSRTVNFQEFQKEIEVEEIMNAIGISRSTVQRAAQSLQENGWLTIQEQPSKKNIYGIPEQFLEKHGCLRNFNPVTHDRPSRAGSKILDLDLDPGSKILDLDLRGKEIEPKPKRANIVSIVNEPEKQDQVSGTFANALKPEDSEVVRLIIAYGVNRSIVDKAIKTMGEDWVTKIFREFNEHIQQPHNMESGPACLAIRLQDYEETWRHEQNPITDKFTAPEISPAKVASWQDKIEENFQKLEFKPEEFLPAIIRDAQRDMKVPASYIIANDILDLHGVEVSI